VNDIFVRLAATGATAWIVLQAFLSIGVVLGLLPAIGVPLPLVSYQPSSLLATVVASGMLISFARREPEAVLARDSSGPGPVQRTLKWLGLGARRQ
jgi:cell division protein FtsW